MTKSAIEWTDRTWNPIRGCSRISAGCENCYAERQAWRSHKPGKAYHGLVKMAPNGRPAWTGKVVELPHLLQQPYSWKTPSMVFVNSMSDLFHPSVSFRFVDQIWQVMRQTPQHRYQILTKRAARMREYLTDYRMRGYHSPSNVWLGVSVEDQRTVNERVRHLLFAGVDQSRRFVSYEPALAPIEYGGWLSQIDWIIIGGESGPRARPFDTAWAYQLIEHASRPDVRCPVFVKQLGANAWHTRDEPGAKIRPLHLESRKGGDPSEWPRGLAVREFPADNLRRIAS